MRLSATTRHRLKLAMIRLFPTVVTAAVNRFESKRGRERDQPEQKKFATCDRKWLGRLERPEIANCNADEASSWN